jgi:hypothetical protein
MKSSIKGLIVILVIVMSFVAVPAVFAGTEAYNNPGYQNDDPGKHEGYNPCDTVVAGEVTWVSTGDGVIVIDDDITVNGLPLWLNIQKGDEVVINCRISPDGKYVACYLTINNGDPINLR